MFILQVDEHIETILRSVNGLEYFFKVTFEPINLVFWGVIDLVIGTIRWEDIFFINISEANRRCGSAL